MKHPFDVETTFEPAAGKRAKIFALPALEKQGFPVSRLPVSIRVVLESLLRNFDGKRVREADLRALAGWQARGERTAEVPFVVARVLLQDFTGVPLLVDLAAMRGAAAGAGKNPKVIEPLVPVDLVIDHSVQVDYFARDDAFSKNLEVEFSRNRARYEFLKWGTGAFDGFRIVPPGIGICHQVNLEFLAKGAMERDGVWLFDTLVGTDSHTTMVNGLGVVGWGVGGIEAEAGMLGQPVYFLTPDVVGVTLHGALAEGTTATDLVLTLTEMLRKAKVVGKFVEFHGEGAATLGASERATIGNMAPEYGATMGFFPPDEETCRYLLATGRDPAHVEAFRRFLRAQGMFGIPRAGECDYTQTLELDLGSVKPSLAGPKRPQDRIELPRMGETFRQLLVAAPPTGYGKSADEINRRHKVTIAPAVDRVTGGGAQNSGIIQIDGLQKNTNPLTESEMVDNRPTPDVVPIEAHPPAIESDLAHGDVVIAAITSCTNTSNPDVMLGAGILAKKAVERGLSVHPKVKTSLAPGSRVVTEYLRKTGLQPYLDALGFQLVGYGCTTCIGNSGPLEPHLEEVLTKNDVVVAAVLSGNRNFEARVHQSVKANFLASPPLVVAFALAGRVDIDMSKQPLGRGKDGKDVFLREIWPTAKELAEVRGAAQSPEEYRRLYSSFGGNPLWDAIHAPSGLTYEWDAESTYIQEPPYFEGSGAPGAPPQKPKDIVGARPLAIFGDSITTDHISPAGAIKATSPAGKYLQERGVAVADFNSYGSRRGNHQVMVRGTFANVRIKNLMAPGTEGGVTIKHPEGQKLSIYDASLAYQKAGTPLVVIAGQEYGTGSSRDWAAKGTRLLGVGAVVARSFERIHRSNLVGMGVLPCQFPDGVSAETLKLDGSETFDLTGLAAGLKPRLEATLVIHRKNGASDRVPVTVRIDTPIEVEYFENGGILPYVLRQILAGA